MMDINIRELIAEGGGGGQKHDEIKQICFTSRSHVASLRVQNALTVPYSLFSLALTWRTTHVLSRRLRGASC